MSKILIRSVIIVLILALIAVAFSLMVRTNELNEEIEYLKDVLSDEEYKKDQLKKELETEVDDEYIKKVAEDELDLVPPNSKVYYSDAIQ